MNDSFQPEPFSGQTKSLTLSACGRSWRISRLANLEDLWNAMGEPGFDEDHIPYWTEVWPSSLALARWLELKQGEIRDELCLEIGCGLGFTALVAKWLGAKVLAIDNEAEALGFCRENAYKNEVASPCWLLMDWRRPAFGKGLFRHIWGADILYEKRFMEPIASFLEHCLAPGGCVWIAEPGRKIFDGFLALARGRAWSVDLVHQISTQGFASSDPGAHARIWEFRFPCHAKHSGAA